ncbi:MAG TPA: hypothetical protein VLA32_05820 [Anaerolineales bacterium]|jgi:hypothetical protein|nr:hypothetical protein [Anaerolineales bacterium]
MGFDPNDDPENDLPEWLRGVQPEDENGGFEPDDSISSDSEEGLPNWMQKDEQGSFQGPETEDEEDTPEWLANIRNEENSRKDQEPPDFSEQDDDDNLAWLESLSEQSEPDEEPEREEEPGDFLEKVQELKARDQAEGSWGDEEEGQPDGELAEEEDDEITAAWKRESGTLSLSEEDDEDELPDWVTGLTSLDPAELPARRDTASGDPQQEDEEIPEWLTDIRQKTSEDTKQPEEVLPAFGIEPDELYEAGSEDDEPVQFEVDEEPLEDEQVDAFSEETEITGSLPSWLENLQTNALVESTEDAEEERLNTAAYVEDEDVSALFEGDDLPDWLDEVEEEEPEEEEIEEELPEQVPALDEEIPKGELPGWLQEIRPVEAVTSTVDEAEGEGEEEREQETVGPLSGLRDVLPAEPHIIHFGSKPKLSTGFELTGAQKQYAELLKSQVKRESASIPAERRSVANPQLVFRWIIAILLLTITFSVLWWDRNILPLPGQDAIPAETFAAHELVNQVQPGERVLVGFEYQPGLAAELEAASASLLDDLLGSGAELVLVSTQPVGPGLAESFLGSQLSGWPYISERRYANLGYVSGGAAGLLNFALDPRKAKPDMSWSLSPLDTINNMMDFAMVLVITDDPDVARSWVEQVQPLMDVGGSDQAVPLVMVVSAQAEPLVYPYYYTTPRQVSGLVSGVSGGAFYESYHGESLARRYWDAYNIGLVLAVFVIAGGSIINLTRTSLNRTGKGRS